MPKIVNPDIAQIEKLGMFQVTYEELAAWFKVNKRTVVRWMEKPAILEAFERGKANGRISLRQAQFKAALAGDKVMLIWMGKQLLGQKDVVVTEHTGEMTVHDGAKERLLGKLTGLIAGEPTREGNTLVN
jgi:hypothetical protein